ncbi:glycosyltransferase [Marinobacter nauticus]|uniref:glycosyltransferase family protein n=1 Tax=Marinobacter nauticus TaxID=2743 RepID=UPI001C98E93A|nr:glycosyltransferase [Marinobacter nauticus]MBY5937711.1 glycosyltransferase [Marinobacter nauticus]MBY5954939.1 glycosyltransferase [Marinobacter nauticus]MBY6008732.1 glycosyltransferase [Marinobacter nauticus]
MTINYSDLNVIFHHPRPITPSGLTGSQVRPYKMLQAFRALGANVYTVTGNYNERRDAAKSIKQMIRNGFHFDLVYSENLTIPFAMSEPHRLPIHPLMDHHFLAYCSAQGIPTSLFNRDVYWRDTSYSAMLPLWGRMITVPFYWFDWWYQSRYLHTVYLPSEAMATALPMMNHFRSVGFLPPGADTVRKRESHQTLPLQGKRPLRLFYVGGIEPPYYDLEPLFTAIKRTPSVNLTLCCREREWAKLKGYYGPYMSDKVTIVHRAGEELISLYQNADLFTVIRGRGSYLDYSVPIKVYEAIGHTLPIVCSPGGETERIVCNEGLGWVKSPQDLPEFLNELRENPAIIEEKRRHIESIQSDHTWTARAAQVCRDLTKSLQTLN